MISAVAATIDIDPDSEMPLAGHGLLEKVPAPTCPEDRLEINGVLLRSGQKTVILLSFDVLFVGSTITNAARSFVGSIDPQMEVCCFATHTHNAPAVDPAKPGLGAASVPYVDYVVSQTLELISTLLKGNLAPVVVVERRGRARHSVNRRGFRYHVTGRGIRRSGPWIKPNLLARRDEELTSWTLQDEAGEIVAFLWKYSCHPVGLDGRMSSHYPGHVRERIRGRKKLPVLFMQGFSGELRPRIMTYMGFRSGTWLGYEFRNFEPDELEKWCESLYRALNRSQITRSSRSDCIHSQRIDVPLARVITGIQDEQRMISFQRIQVSDAMDLFCVSAEMFSSYNRYLSPKGIGVGCEGNTFGYIPSANAIERGGYEPRWSLDLFGLSGGYSAETERVTSATLQALQMP